MQVEEYGRVEASSIGCITNSFNGPKGVLTGGQFTAGTVMLLNKPAIKGSIECPEGCLDDNHET